MRLYTIGFTKTTAESFFSRLSKAGVKKVIDVRLNNVSQLAGFTKRDDLRYFTKVVCDIEYVHILELAPTSEILDPYKKQKNGDWALYERQFLDLMFSRAIERLIAKYPQYRALALPRDSGAVVRIVPDRILAWRYR